MAQMSRETDIAGRITIKSWIDQSLFAGLAELLRCTGVSPGLDDLNRLFAQEPGAKALRFAAQTPELRADGLHYEERIARQGIISTREDNAHDLFNALIWLYHEPLKRAMNSRQVADIAKVGPRQRTRGQCALTHFDEAGAIVWVSGADVANAWDTHDWRRLFGTHRDAWGKRIAVTVIGHALFDFALDHGELPVAKALAVEADPEEIAKRSRGALIASWPDAEASIARAIEAGRWLADPQELRPLPLAGIPGWHEGAQSDDFYESAPSFRPLRAGRRYPKPRILGACADSGGNENTIARAAIR
jgi:hypothetical protein